MVLIKCKPHCLRMFWKGCIGIVASVLIVVLVAGCGGEKEDTYTQNVDGTINGHDYVDLGLSVKWATCNVGASSFKDYGDYFAWGETSTKSTYTEDNSKTYGESSYNYDIGGDASLDAARANWGGTWRLPTEKEAQELRGKCSWEWITKDGKDGEEGYKGFKVTGPNKNSIFLPVAGYRNGPSLYDAGQLGYIWTSAPYEEDAEKAFRLHFAETSRYVAWGRRYYGRTIRPVSE